MFAGNVGIALLHDSPCAVAVAPHGYAEATHSGITQVTVGYDGSPDAHMALDDAAELAAAADVPLKVVTVAETPPIVYGKGGGPNYSWQALREDIKQIMRQRLDEALETLPSNLEAEGTLIEGEAPAELAGRRGRRTVAARLAWVRPRAARDHRLHVRGPDALRAVPGHRASALGRGRRPRG